MFFRKATQSSLNRGSVSAKRYWRFSWWCSSVTHFNHSELIYLCFYRRAGHKNTEEGREQEEEESDSESDQDVEYRLQLQNQGALLELQPYCGVPLCVLIHCHTDVFLSSRLWCIVLGKQRLAEATTRSVWTFVSRWPVPGERLSEVHIWRKGRPPAAE